tara:strand:- start:3966 stop:4457 length:492 start_codon:yes stop_codon:yes gene_type:complete
VREAINLASASREELVNTTNKGDIMRISKLKVEKWTELVDEMSNQLYELEDSINKAEKECQEITHLQSDIYNSVDSDDEIDTSDIQDTCNKISRYAEDTIQEIGEAQGIFDDKQNGINKKFDVLFKELDDLLKPNVFQRFFTWLSCSIEKVKSYRILFKIVRK